MDNNVFLMHAPSFNVPYMCRLCGYKCIKTREYAKYTTHLKEHIEKRKSSRDEFKYMVVATTSYKIAEGKDPERFDHTISKKIGGPKMKKGNRWQRPLHVFPQRDQFPLYFRLGNFSFSRTICNRVFAQYYYG